MNLIVSPLAERDIEKIGDYIAEDNPKRALSFVRELHTQCTKISLNPLAYRSRAELGDQIRSCAYGNYVIFYRVGQDSVMIVRVLHGAMDVVQGLSDDA